MGDNTVNNMATNNRNDVVFMKMKPTELISLGNSFTRWNRAREVLQIQTHQQLAEHLLTKLTNCTCGGFRNRNILKGFPVNEHLDTYSDSPSTVQALSKIKHLMHAIAKLINKNILETGQVQLGSHSIQSNMSAIAMVVSDFIKNEADAIANKYLEQKKSKQPSVAESQNTTLANVTTQVTNSDRSIPEVESTSNSIIHSKEQSNEGFVCNEEKQMSVDSNKQQDKDTDIHSDICSDEVDALVDASSVSGEERKNEDKTISYSPTKAEVEMESETGRDLSTPVNIMACDDNEVEIKSSDVQEVTVSQTMECYSYNEDNNEDSSDDDHADGTELSRDNVIVKDTEKLANKESLKRPQSFDGKGNVSSVKRLRVKKVKHSDIHLSSDRNKNTELQDAVSSITPRNKIDSKSVQQPTNNDVVHESLQFHDYTSVNSHGKHMTVEVSDNLENEKHTMEVDESILPQLLKMIDPSKKDKIKIKENWYYETGRGMEKIIEIEFEEEEAMHILHKNIEREYKGKNMVKKIDRKPVVITIAEDNFEEINPSVYARKVCNYCREQFDTLKELISHEKTHSDSLPFVCSFKECNERFASESDQVSHHVKHPGPPYGCDVCPYIAESRLYVKRHKKTVHNNDGPATCKLCDKTLKNRSCLRNHIRHMHFFPNKRHQCRFCTKSFRDKKTCRQHERLHTGETPYRCQYCNKLFTNQASKTRHERVHTGEKPYECGLCYERFVDSSSCSKHISAHHLTSAPGIPAAAFQCEFCQKTFKRKDLLQSHWKTHTDTYPCQTCGAEFKTNIHLKRHLYFTHSIGSLDQLGAFFQCSYCQKVNNTKKENEAHERRCKKYHEAEKLYQCVKCDATYLTVNSLKRHMLRSCGKNTSAEGVVENSSMETIKVQPPDIDPNFTQNVPTGAVVKHLDSKKCEHCDKVFFSEDHFQEHVKSHTTLERYQCPHCKKKYKYEKELKRHLFFYHNIGTMDELGKVFTCKFCEKVFSSEKSLDKHKKKCDVLSSKSYVLQCQQCDKRFENTKQILNHIKKCKKNSANTTTVPQIKPKVTKMDALTKPSTRMGAKLDHHVEENMDCRLVIQGEDLLTLDGGHSSGFSQMPIASLLPPHSSHSNNGQSDINSMEIFGVTQHF